MIAYETADGRLVATQREAGKGFRPCNVPREDKAALLAFINGRSEKTERLPAPPLLSRPEPAATAPETAVELGGDVEGAIMAAAAPAAARHALAAVERLGELGAAGRAAIAGARGSLSLARGAASLGALVLMETAADARL
jgi:hypothetical protein